MRIRSVAASVFGTVLLTSCGGGSSVPKNETAPIPPVTQEPRLFRDITSGSGIDFSVGFSENPGDDAEVSFFAGGVASGDYDDDGDIDMFVVRGDVGPNLLYRNDGNNAFAEVAGAAGLAFTKSATENYRHSGPMFADIDGDGDLDLFIGGVQGDPCRVFANNGDGTFTDVTSGSGLDAIGARQTISAAFGDYDLDGDLDLLVSHWRTERSYDDPGDTEHLWRNDSTSTEIQFVSVSVEAGLSPSIITLPDPFVPPSGLDVTFAPSFARVNDDLYPDILMVADFNTTKVFMNNQDGTFSNVTDVDVLTDRNGMGSALGDYDNDGDLDWFVTSIFRETQGTFTNGNRLYRNDGGQFVDVTEAVGVANGGWGWAACLVDLDNDGHLDIYHTNGWREVSDGDFSADQDRAFVSDGAGGFSDRATSLGFTGRGQGRGVVCADFDRDGDVDVFVWKSEATDGGTLYRNETSVNNFLRVKLNGLPPNTGAAGARIKSTVGAVSQLREVALNSNFISQNPAVQIIGLGSAAQTDSLIIEWPDGRMTDMGVVDANQNLLIDHPDL
ncbi:MAG: CRTAC1 family protein [Gammaproteobacteria bacterium]|nr:CRTAC1 family protein [Gammaproteobacteria bacterium]MDH3749947.1 CRTAC1 family protein [Gammaproteobacteria bacterium]